MKSTIVFGIMRGGSSIAFDIVRRLLGCAGVGYDDFIGRAYDNGISLDHLPADLHGFAPRNQLYGPFRECPDWLFKTAAASPLTKILVIRDPRDCLVSHHFISKKTHSSFQSATAAASDFDIQRARHYSNIDVHALVWSRYFRLRFERYRALCQIDPKLHVYRYEDMAADFNGWIDDLVEVLSLPPHQPCHGRSRFD